VPHQLLQAGRNLVRIARTQESMSEEAKGYYLEGTTSLYERYRKLSAASKEARKIATAAAPELLGFIWAIRTRAEAVAKQQVLTTGTACMVAALLSALILRITLAQFAVLQQLCVQC
jgi:hypothetical protein